MKLPISILAVLFLFLSFDHCQAQFSPVKLGERVIKRAGKNTERAIEQEANKKVDKEIDKILTPKKKSKAPKTDKTSTEAKLAPASSQNTTTNNSSNSSKKAATPSKKTSTTPTKTSDPKKEKSTRAQGGLLPPQ